MSLIDKPPKFSSGSVKCHHTLSSFIYFCRRYVFFWVCCRQRCYTAAIDDMDAAATDVINAAFTDDVTAVPAA
eukprot:scaffold406837_cov51-Attheya_sp.AAC.1